jgi:ribonucleoside-triphosphate reductase
MTSKYGVPYFANFVNSDMDAEDARSMCCRLRLDNRELHKRMGGLFGSAPLTGSIGVVTINLPRIGYLAKDKKDFLKRLDKLMDLAEESLEIKRKIVENYTVKGLYPYAKFYLDNIFKRRGSYWGNHFSTIGIVGMNESIVNFLKTNIATKKGLKFAEDVLTHMRERMIKYQEETGNLYNLEATPAEGTSYRLALKDKKRFPQMIFANNGAVENGAAPYYTNSSQLPVGYSEDVFEALDLQDDLQTKYTGGTVFHIFLGEKINDINTTKSLVKKISSNYKLPYFTLSPTFSICPTHGYIAGEHHKCPKCVIDQPCEVYSRIVGYIRPVQQWNDGKAQEFKDRKMFQVKEAN